MKTLFAVCILFATNLCFAQSEKFALAVHLDPSTSPGYKQTVRLKAYLKNISSSPVNISKPTPYVLWRIDDWDWNLSINNQQEKFFKFVERPDRRYASKDKMTLAAGDSILIYAHQWEMNKEGIYKASFRYAQEKSKADEVYVEKKQLEDREDFQLLSNTVEFKVAKVPAVRNTTLLSYDELLNKEVFSDSYIAPAFLKPGEIYRLKVKNASNHQALTDFPNVQWTEIDALDTDTVPDLYCNWNLQYLTFNTAKQGKHVFPVSFAAGGNLRYLQFNYGMNNKMPEWVYKQSKLEYLRIFGTLITELDPCLFELKGLKYLDLNPVNIDTIPPHIVQLRKLETLKLMSVGFSDLNFLSQLPNLKEVVLFGKNLNPKDPNILALRAKGAMVNVNGWMR